MSNRFFGLSNIYLRAAVLMIVASVVLLFATLVIPAVGGPAVNYAFAFLLLAGALLYVIGRVTSVLRSRGSAQQPR
ncbi:hypothetical protein [Alkalisalibacterium limincola]|uniref:Uncharacterized protein n=1 Tax=Alkalisalibacterium limincola TaxID=2699169 RepID=A0A5C8KWS6_9GAMM|nr:hypothetical protein [Alkalisalibacterium limincola]TXK65110.1 hypothetical protein FU658_04870 [Alkalisalibacterium limincola]